MILGFSLSFGADLPSYQCVDKYEASFFNHKGEIVPENKKASGKSKLNVMIVPETKDGKIQIKALNVNGNELMVTTVKNGYVYAIEFTKGGMHSWVLFEDKNGKTYITLSKTYDLMGPLTSYSLYECEQVNNRF